jgi:hypothetical protein
MVAAEIVSLPKFHQLTAEQQVRVVSEVAQFSKTLDESEKMAWDDFCGTVQ